ncbi:Bifunctional P-450/NADPH-P450 reductase [Mycobacterium marinum]|uniref:cytochrome P450 n=1 Tax=Mycobacterium marinum TaxID=1781 RepID=UPI000E3D2771|nr:cytochrome P450 [Mycobacterium marinum]RFZ62040.1 Bifunctional P-450/NADPH-P450 reductase [Mycobacterium marinum]
MTPTTTPQLPHPRWRLPILGDLLTIDLAKPSQGLARDITSHNGIVEQRIFHFPVIVLSDTGLINDVNDETHWEKHVGHSLRKLRPVAGDGLFTAYNHEPNWRKAHNILMPAFTRAAMESYHPTMTATVRELIETWSTHAANGSWIDIPTDANRLTTEIVARAGIGHSFSKLDNTSNDPFITTVLRELKYANRRTDAIPFYEKFFGQSQRSQHQQDKVWLREQIATIINDRRNAGPHSGPPDMLDYMLNTDDPDTGERLDDANITNQILTLLVAGSETSANAIGFALHYLASNPSIAASVRAEIDQRWPERSFPEIAFDDVARLRCLRRIVDETLRLWPVAPGYFRQAKTDTTIGDGAYHFAAGDWVFVLLLAAHRDPATWGPDADQFRPDRFLPENLRQLPPHVYKPFGTGARACIGRQFALHEIMLTLAAVLHQFYLHPEPNYQLKVSETLTLKPDALRLRLTSR